MGETITLKAADGHTLGGLSSRRPSAAPHGGVVVVQEIFGVNSHIRSVCDRFAKAGYLAIAPAIYDRIERDVQLGYTPEDITRGRDIRGNVHMEDVMLDISAAIDAIAEAGKVGIVGYCWGGTIVYVAACRLGGKLSCGAGYYGGNIVSHLNEKPAIPLTPALRRFGYLDPGRRHRANSRRPPGRDACMSTRAPTTASTATIGKQFNADAARAAERRTLDFFATHLA